jgi:prolyl-tRNA synthetase
VEKATSKLAAVEDLPATGDGSPELVHTPGQRTIDEVGAFLQVQPHHQMKTMAYMVEHPGSDEKQIKVVGKTRAVVVFLRGDHQINETKLASIAGGELRPMQPEEIAATFNSPAGYLGPIGLTAAPHPKKPGILIVLDAALEGRTNLIAGANKEEYHLRNVTPMRDFKPTLVADVRSVNEGEPDPIGGLPLRIGKAVEVGHIFKLGDKYTKSMGASVLNRDGKETTPIMGCYGIGIERILTAAIEQSAGNYAKSGQADSYALPPSIAPFQVVVTITNVREAELLQAGESIASQLHSAGFDVLLDDRDERAGVKFKDAELIGVPFRFAIGKKLADGKVEVLNRLTNQTDDVPVDAVTTFLKALLPANS